MNEQTVSIMSLTPANEQKQLLLQRESIAGDFTEGAGQTVTNTPAGALRAN